MMVQAKEKHDLDQLRMMAFRRNTCDILMGLASQLERHACRTRLEFAQDVIYIPNGKHQGEKWRATNQPVHAELLRMMDESECNIFAITGCVQSGKTLVVVVINILWHLFDRRDISILGVPKMEDAFSKWSEDILPVMLASPELKKMLPDGGVGSKGGTKFESITFKNGVTLRFMGAKGSDSNRSGFTARVVLKTEVDRYDTATDASRESSPSDQMDARTASYGSDANIYEECTVTTPEGRIWQQLNAGTNRSCHYQCPHCMQWIRPMRTDFLGVLGCANIIEAGTRGSFYCAKCKAKITQEERDAMLDHPVMVAEGQQIITTPEGDSHAVGPLKKTDVESFWWNAFDNRFITTNYIAREEYKAVTAEDPVAGEKKVRQFTWALPAESQTFVLTPLKLKDVLARQRTLGFGQLPESIVSLSAGVDLRDSQLHYVVIAWTTELIGHVIDFNILPVDTDSDLAEIAIVDALRILRDTTFSNGYIDGDGTVYRPGSVFIDGGYRTPAVRAFIVESADQFPGRGVEGHDIYNMIFGRGISLPAGHSGAYNHPTKVSDTIQWIGRECYRKYHQDYGTDAFFLNVDYGKTHLREAIAIDDSKRGSVVFPEAKTESEHQQLRQFVTQVLAEKQSRREVIGRGPVTVWTNDTGKNNHYGDALNYACFASQAVGVDYMPEITINKMDYSQVDRIGLPDGSLLDDHRG